MRFGALGDLDDLAERNRPLHGCVVTNQALRQTLLGQRLPAANDLGRVIHLELVALVLEQVLQAAADVRLLHGQHNHLVVDEQAALDSFGERDDVQFLAVERRIVHAAQGDVLLFGAGLGMVAIDARRGRHVKALVGSDVVAVVDLDEAAFVFVVERRAGGAVGLVAHDQVERAQPVQALGLADDVDRVVGGRA